MERIFLNHKESAYLNHYKPGKLTITGVGNYKYILLMPGKTQNGVALKSYT